MHRWMEATQIRARWLWAILNLHLADNETANFVWTASIALYFIVDFCLAPHSGGALIPLILGMIFIAEARERWRDVQKPRQVRAKLKSADSI